MKYGTVPSSAFMDGHTTVLLPLAYWLAAKLTLLHGCFKLTPHRQGAKDPITYYFRVMPDGCFVFTKIPEGGVDYGDPLPIPERILNAAFRGDRLPDLIVEREKEALIEKFAEMTGGEVISLNSVRMTLDGKTYTVTLQER